MAIRREVLNVLLAQLLQERGLVAAPEQIQTLPEEAVAMPDVLVDFQGLRMAIEGEVSPPKPGGVRTAQNKARRAALRRVEQGIAHVGVALVYPSHLRLGSFDSMKAELSRASLRFAVITESTQQTAYLFPELAEEPVQFASGDLGTLAEALRRAYDQLIQDEVLQLAVRRVETGIEYFLNALRIQPASTVRFTEALEVREIAGKGPAAKVDRARLEREGHRGHLLTPEQRAAINRVSGLVVINAMVFQEVLSRKDDRVRPLQWFWNHQDPVLALGDHWKFILDEINYYPIFHVAQDLLRCLSADKDMTAAMHRLLDTARCIVDWRVPLRHDLAGRLYHRLLLEAKYLGAYYTSIPASVMLLKLALDPRRWHVDWSDLGALKAFRIADFACGTGTLLMAAADAVVDNYVRARASRGRRLRMDGLHNALVGQVIYGFDVLDSAVHLTASTLALRSPELPINVTHLGKRVLGGESRALGSLDFLESPNMGTLFTQPTLVVGRPTQEATRVAERNLPMMDLCVMNPPFTRSVGGNALFGHLPQEERADLQEKLRDIVSRRGLSASITAGLGSVFIALGDMYLRQEGRLAFVIPRALLSGVAWGRTRELLERKYHLEWLVVSHEPNHWNFSENTDLSEVLVVARKRTTADEAERVGCVNLWRQPRNAVEALTVARMVQEGAPPDVQAEQGILDISIGEKKLGEAVSVPWEWLQHRLWSLPCAFAQAELIRTLFHLLEGRVSVPGQHDSGAPTPLRLCPLKALGDLGFDCRDMHDGFSVARSATPYPAFWSHDARAVTRLQQAPNKFLAPLPRAKDGRPLRRADHLWQKAGHILLAERLWLKTMRLTAVRTTQEVLSNVWWPFLPHVTGPEAEKALVLWLNSSLGLLLLIGHREETRGAWVKFKKAVLEEMPVLDVRALGDRARGRLAEAFDQIADKALLPFPELAGDPTRAAIDSALADALKLPDMGPLRELLAREPILCLSLDKLMSE